MIYLSDDTTGRQQGYRAPATLPRTDSRGTAGASSTRNLQPSGAAAPTGSVQRQATSDPDRVADLHLDITGQGADEIGALRPQRCAGDAPSAECSLTAEERTNLRTELSSRIDAVRDVWMHALTLLELHAAVKRGPGIGGALVDVAMGAMVMVSGVAGGVGLVVKAIAGQVGGAVKGAIASVGATAPEWGNALVMVPLLWAEYMRNTLPPAATDAELRDLVASLSCRVLDYRALQAQVDDLVTRYRAQVEPVDGADVRPANLLHQHRDGSGRYASRLALVEWHPMIAIHGDGIEARTVSAGVNRPLDGATFVRWIDDDMATAAVNRDGPRAGLWLDTYAGGLHEQVYDCPELLEWYAAVEGAP